MVRRATSSASEEDQEQSTLSNGAKVKAEKVKLEKGKKEKERGSRRARVEEILDEDDPRSQFNKEDGTGEGEEDEDEGTPKGRKRVRVDDDGEARTVKPGRVPRARVQTLPRDKDGWVPGSIMRVQLRNFVTYDYTEFRPGSALNMILGPNGTGKSSIACAICLGLNWPPSVLGRATELPSFVKLGAKDGHIEIELKGLPGKPNLVIKRTLYANSKRSDFTLNGKSTTGMEIKQKMAALNVQVGNLCSFLPQDKVSEFAQMSPVQLLKETQRAAGDERLTQWHQTLIESGKELRGVQELIKGEKDQLTVMVARNTEQERDVERFRTREKIEKKIEELELLIPNQTFLEAKKHYLDAKNVQRAAFEKAKILREKNQPARDRLEAFVEDHKKLNKKREGAKKKVTATFTRMREKWAESDKLDTAVEKLQTEIGEAKKMDKARATKIKNYEASIARLEEQRAHPPKTEDLRVINEEFKALNEGRNEKKLAHNDLKSRSSDVGEAAEREKQKIEQCNKELRQLEDKGHRKLEELRRWDMHTHDAVVWLRQNQSEFKEPIIEPPLLCMTVPNKRFASSVEACLNSNQIRTLVAQNSEDLDKLNSILNDSDRVLKKGGRVNTWYRPPSVPIAPPPLSPEEMGRLGFQGYAMDFIDCPEGLKSFLQRDVQLHRTAIGLDGGRVNVDQASTAVARNGGATFIAGSVINNVRRSRYGKKAAQNMTAEVRQARNFADNAIDPAEQKRIDDRIKEAKTQLNVIEQEMSEITKELAEHKKDDDEYNRIYAALERRKKAINDAQTAFAKLGHKIVQEQDQLRAVRSEPSAEARTANSKQKIVKMTRDRLKIAKEYAVLMRSVVRDQAEMTRVTLEHAQVGANKNALEILVNERDAESNAATDAYLAADAVLKEARQASKTTLAVAKAVIANASDELRDRYKIIEAEGIYANKTSDELREDLETEKNNLELNTGASAGVVEQYEKRKREIEALTATIAAREKNAERTERAIKNARDNWEPALEALVASIGKKFSAAFDRIGCAGEIHINKHEDFDKWAIDILVKFREKEKLQLLTGQRQSGGERSLTTILYLMSLTEEARSPFSLVDEINQGMDMRAERAVHNSMVQVTCKPDSGQYFLITPKLLPDLNYHERMKVLCVNNGEWLPEERHLGNMMGMIESCAQRRTRSANTV